MTENKTVTPKRKPIDFGKIYRDLLKHKRLYYIVLPLAFALSALYMLSIPNYYTCTVKLSPELSNRSTSTSSLASLASSFGVKLGSGMGNSSEALFPTLYPDLMTSVDFKADLFKIKVRPEDATQEYSYYDYKKNIEKKPWWSQAVKSLMALFKSDEEDADTINPRQLTKKQYVMAKAIEDNVTCLVDKKTMVISLSVKDHDPLVCTTMADSTMALLQRYITDYRTSKARVDLEYNKKLLAEAKRNYEKASRAYASFSDANLHSFQERILQRKAELETEMMLQRTVYQQVVAQYQQAEMKLQEDTPAFAVIQASTIPAKKTGPKRASSCVICLFLAFICVSIYALYKEDDLKNLFGL
ncbi:hypothetical protein [Prevotella sp. P6B1]|uniref:hypothetical protein n=1 Tax=Prevotella sp. P6B1 TaxID=1410613 RepID=UPI00051CA6B2|nr:hypothetical protein [Prevotella sp. P6B1]